MPPKKKTGRAGRPGKTNTAAAIPAAEDPPLPPLPPPESPAVASLPSVLAHSTTTAASSITVETPIICGTVDFSDSNSKSLEDSIFNDPLITKLPNNKGWTCTRCGHSCLSKEPKRVIAHLLKKKGFKIKACTAVISEADHARYQRLLLTIQQKSTARKRSAEVISTSVESHHEGLGGDVIDLHQQRQKPVSSSCKSGGHQLSMRSFASAAAAQSRAVSSTSTQSRFAARGQPSIDASVQNMTRSDIRFTQNHHLTAAISDWAHAEGLPFNIAESARFQSVLTKARLVGDDYTPPNRKLISGDMLTLNHSKIMEKNTKDFKKHISTFGALAMGDGATIAKMPLVNELWQTGDMPPTVFGIHDCTGHMAAGGKKDAEYIAGLFEGTCHKFDPDNAMGLIDIFAFDGASNVQKAGDILNVKYPTSHTIHGVEHVFSLFFDDCAKLKPIKVCVCMMLSIGSLVVLP